MMPDLAFGNAIIAEHISALAAQSERRGAGRSRRQWASPLRSSERRSVPAVSATSCCTAAFSG